MKLERLIAIIYKLLNNDVISAATLAEEFQVAPRTIYRDIDAICAAGFPVISYQGNKGGYGMIEGYKMDKSLLGSYDVTSLITVLSSLSSVFKDERAQGTIDRLRTIGSEHETSSLAVDIDARNTDPETLPRLRTAITERKVVRFDYINAKNERTTREIEPIKLHYKYSNWYIYGYCLAREDYREFRLSRMIFAQLTDQTFEPHQELKEATKKEWLDPVEEVVITVGPETLADALDRFHHVEKHFQADGSMTMRIPVYRPLEARWLWSILLSFGGGAEVLEPKALRTVIKNQLQQALILYEEV
ncbi:YafY family protein [Paenibacillus sp. NEAU-GSW1]|uniref:helix-turn-helix transcriptional regulator n=1 Tax=Paenibacillus sp. NEAU-GSW1 TaxID=2682486 RepID=UPI0012E32382|nr:YafY family protein [Paenibacillus sp. NEAU-GSW1]MUT68814.1 WYL domain-containing protein [Paenibacillus sp. NEAU-GSW1]